MKFSSLVGSWVPSFIKTGLPIAGGRAARAGVEAPGNAKAPPIAALELLKKPRRSKGVICLSLGSACAWRRPYPYNDYVILFYVNPYHNVVCIILLWHQPFLGNPCPCRPSVYPAKFSIS